MDQEALLSYWLKIHKKALNTEFRRQFLASEDARVICLYEDAHIKKAVKKSPKLKVILQHLRDGFGDFGGGPSGKPRKSGPDGPAMNVPATADIRRSRTGRSRSRTSVWDAPVPYGTTDPRYK